MNHTIGLIEDRDPHHQHHYQWYHRSLHCFDRPLLRPQVLRCHLICFLLSLFFEPPKVRRFHCRYLDCIDVIQAWTVTLQILWSPLASFHLNQSSVITDQIERLDFINLDQKEAERQLTRFFLVLETLFCAWYSVDQGFGTHRLVDNEFRSFLPFELIAEAWIATREHDLIDSWQRHLAFRSGGLLTFKSGLFAVKLVEEI